MALTIRAAAQAHSPVGRRRAAFTLIELLIGITIIATLIGILLPVLAGARNAAHGAVCLSNLHQHGMSWLNQQQDHRFFPFERPDDLRIHHIWDWGGVNWYDPEVNTPAADLVAGPRPLNPYYDIPKIHRAGMDVFRCPADDGLKYAERVPYFSRDDFIGLSKAANPSTLYGVRGSSYMANEWLWIKPGSIFGFGGGGRQNAAGFTTKNSMVDVTDPSRFIVVGDTGPFQAGRMGSDRFMTMYGGLGTGAFEGSWQYSWWHGDQRGQMAFLDGSARAVDIVPHRGSTGQYMWWLNPSLHMGERGSATVGLHGGMRLGWDSRGREAARE